MKLEKNLVSKSTWKEKMYWRF